MSERRIRMQRYLLILLIAGTGLVLVWGALSLAQARNTLIASDIGFSENEDTRLEPGAWGFSQDWQIEFLGLSDAVEFRELLNSYRAVQGVLPGTLSQEELQAWLIARRLLVVRMSQMARNTTDPAVATQTLNLLGVMHAEEGLRMLAQKDEAAGETLMAAIETFKQAIKADASDTFNEPPKENLEALLRMLGSGGPPPPSGGGSEDNPGEPGTSDPGDGY